MGDYLTDLPYEYDPRALGAQCDRCSLFGHPVVPSKGLARGSELAIVAEAPGAVEEALAEPLVGPSGQELDRALLAAGLRREDTFLTNVCLCRPHDMNMDGHLATVAKQNKRRKKAGEPLVLPAPVACYPRLMHELQGAKALLLMGAYARQIFYPKERGESKLMSSRGFPSWAEVKPAETPGELEAISLGASVAAHVQGRLVRCLATVHPAHALRIGRWIPVFRGDVDKAVRMSRDQLRWREPEMLRWPTPEQLANFLAEIDSSRQPIAYDTETRFGLDWSKPKALRLLGIGTAKRVVCVPFQSVEEHPAYVYTAEQLRRLGEILVNWFAGPGTVCSHNGRKFDRLVCSHAKEYLPGWRMGRREFDTVLAHHVAFSEHMHGLEFLSAQYTDAPAHKAVDHSKWHEEGDYKYHTYNMHDVAITAIVAEALARDQKLIEQKVVLEKDHKLSDFCRGMEETGIWVDRAACAQQAEELGVEMGEARTDLRRMLHDISKLEGGERLGKELQQGWDFNPGSPQQVGKLLYDLLEIEPLPADQGGLTDTGLPSTDKPVLFLLCDRGVPQVVEDLIQRIIDYRESHKLKSTYCDPLMPGSKRREKGDIRLTDDGRMHVVWNPHVVVSGRLSASPNVMNFKDSMRAILAAPPGHAFACCDKSQLEARIVAILAGEEKQIAAFLAGADIHKVNAVDLFGLKSVDMVTPELRQFTKTFVYAAQYLAGPKKIAQMLRVFRDKKGKRPYRLYSVAEAKSCHERLWASRAAIMQFHERNRELQQEVGYLADYIHGRRRYFLDGIMGDNIKEELANYLIQGCKCPFTRVLTRSGLLPIGEVAETGEVWTGSRWAPYQKLNRGSCELAVIRFTSGQEHYCDTRDEVLIEGAAGYEFCSWADLHEGDRVCFSLPGQRDCGSSQTGVREAYWLGFFVGNGSTSPDRPGRNGRRNALTVTIGNRKGRYRREDKVAELIEFLRSRGYEPQKSRVYSGHTNVRVQSWESRDWLVSTGYPWAKDAHEKFVPTAIWSSSLDERRAFVLGLLDADGCVRPGTDTGGQANLHMCNRKLLAEVQLLLRTVGVRSRLHGPYQDGISWRLNINNGQLAVLGYGEVKRRPKRWGTVPGYVVTRFLARFGALAAVGRTALPARHTSDATLFHRMRTGGSVSPYVLADLAEKYLHEPFELYAAEEVVETRALGVVSDTFTLSVDDPGHRFDSEGVISKNTAAADVNDSTFRLVEAFPWGFDGPNTGLIHQNHDSLVIECREEHVVDVGKRMTKIMDSHYSRMPLPVELKVGGNYRDLEKVKG